MKRIALTLFTASIVLFACNSSDKKEGTKKADKMTDDTASTSTSEKKWIPIDSNMMNKAWAESMTLGEPHKMLAKGAGTWDAEVTMWMADGSPPTKSTSSSVNTMLFGGLYQMSKHSGNMMGMPFEGMSIAGYDNT